MKKVLDEYEVKARYVPTFFAVLPMVHLATILLGKTFWNELGGNIGWMVPTIVDLSLYLIVMLFFIQLQSSFGKIWIEESVFGKGGENFPTTDMLLYQGGLISKQRKNQLRSMISELFGSVFSTEDGEKIDPLNARLQAREAVGHVKTEVGPGIMTIRYNIRYGFFRNLIAGVAWCTIGSLGCSILYFQNSNWIPMGFFFAYFVTSISLFFFKRRILEKLAFNYADTLFTEFLSQIKGEQ